MELVDLFLKDAARYPVLSREEQFDLGRRARDGDEVAQEKLVLHNLRFVFHVAKRYSRTSFPMEELIAEGNRGLLHAATKFDPQHGVTFGSYAYHWIESYIRKFIAYHRSSGRLTATGYMKLRRVQIATERFVAEHRREPTIEELVALTGLPESSVRDVLEVNLTNVSLDAALKEGDEDSGRLHEMLASDEDFESDTEFAFGADRLDEVMRQVLPPRERIILRLCYDMDGTGEMALRDIAPLLGIGRERVRQLRDRALARLREHLDPAAFGHVRAA